VVSVDTIRDTRTTAGFCLLCFGGKISNKKNLQTHNFFFLFVLFEIGYQGPHGTMSSVNLSQFTKDMVMR
jgi:hypothetical protein